MIFGRIQKGYNGQPCRPCCFFAIQGRKSWERGFKLNTLSLIFQFLPYNTKLLQNSLRALLCRVIITRKWCTTDVNHKILKDFRNKERAGCQTWINLNQLKVVKLCMLLLRLLIDKSQSKFDNLPFRYASKEALQDFKHHTINTKIIIYSFRFHF